MARTQFTSQAFPTATEDSIEHSDSLSACGVNGPQRPSRQTQRVSRYLGAIHSESHELLRQPSIKNQNHDRQKRRCGGLHHEAWTPVARLHHRLGEPAISAVKNQGRGVNGGGMVAAAKNGNGSIKQPMLARYT